MGRAIDPALAGPAVWTGDEAADTHGALVRAVAACIFDRAMTRLAHREAVQRVNDSRGWTLDDGRVVRLEAVPLAAAHLVARETANQLHVKHGPHGVKE